MPLNNFSYSKEDQDFSWYNTFVPMLRLVYVLQLIMEAGGYKLSEDTGIFASTDAERLIIVNNCSIDKLRGVGIGDEFCVNDYSTSWDLSEFVPDQGAKEFFQKFLDYMQLYFKVEGNCVSICAKADALKQPSKDLTEVCTFKTVPKRGTYKVEYDLSPDVHIGPFGQLNTLGDENAKDCITPTFSTLYMRDVDVDIDPLEKDANPLIQTTLRLPIIETKGCSDETNVGQNDIGCKLLLYHGIFENADGYSYAYASHDNLDPLGNTGISDLNLSITDDDGIGKQYLKPVYDLANNRTLTISQYLDIQTILEIIKFDHPWTVKTDEHGIMTGMITGINFKVNCDRIGEVKIDMVSLC